MSLSTLYGHSGWKICCILVLYFKLRWRWRLLWEGASVESFVFISQGDGLHVTVSILMAIRGSKNPCILQIFLLLNTTNQNPVEDVATSYEPFVCQPGWIKIVILFLTLNRFVLHGSNQFVWGQDPQMVIVNVFCQSPLKMQDILIQDMSWLNTFSDCVLFIDGHSFF